MTFKLRSKYGARPTTVDGIRFASQAEAAQYGRLKLLARVGAIRDLELQPEYELHVAGVRIGKYVGDFRYYKPDGELVVEDCKGFPTPVYRLKKKLVAALYGIQIVEIR